jgi:hypothetical protein
MHLARCLAAVGLWGLGRLGNGQEAQRRRRSCPSALARPLVTHGHLTTSKHSCALLHEPGTCGPGACTVTCPAPSTQQACVRPWHTSLGRVSATALLPARALHAPVPALPYRPSPMLSLFHGAHFAKRSTTQPGRYHGGAPRPSSTATATPPHATIDTPPSHEPSHSSYRPPPHPRCAPHGCLAAASGGLCAPSLETAALVASACGPGGTTDACPFPHVQLTQTRAHADARVHTYAVYAKPCVWHVRVCVADLHARHEVGVECEARVSLCPIHDGHLQNHEHDNNTSSKDGWRAACPALSRPLWLVHAHGRALAVQAGCDRDRLCWLQPMAVRARRNRAAGLVRLTMRPCARVYERVRAAPARLHAPAWRSPPTRPAGWGRPRPPPPAHTHAHAAYTRTPVPIPHTNMRIRAGARETEWLSAWQLMGAGGACCPRAYPGHAGVQERAAARGRAAVVVARLKRHVGRCALHQVACRQLGAGCGAGELAGVRVCSEAALPEEAGLGRASLTCAPKRVHLCVRHASLGVEALANNLQGGGRLL